MRERDDLYLAIAIAALGLVACDRPPVCPESVVMVVSDAGSKEGQNPDPEGEPFDLPGGYSSPVCLEACLNLKRLGCPEGVSRPGEEACYIVCRRSESTNGRVNFRPACIAAAKNKSEILACKTYRCL